MNAQPIARWTIEDIGTLDQVSFSARLPLAGIDAFSLSLWYCAADNHRIQIIADIGDLLTLRLDNGALVCEFTVAGKSQIIQLTAPESGRWHHVMIRSGEVLSLHVDSNWIASQPSSKPLQIAPDSILRIGGYTDPAGGHFDHTFGRNQSGWVDDICMFDRELSLEAVAQMIPTANIVPDVAFKVELWSDGRADLSVISAQVEDFKTFLWDFGDGYSGIGPHVVHQYAFDGDYTVRLTALTADYQSATREQTIQVTGIGQQPEIVPVFVNGTEGYACYRIPSIVRAANGDLIAFAEARLESCSDSTATIRLVCKRSSDQGRSWSELQVVARNMFGGREYVVQNPSPVVDYVRGTGRILMLYNKMEHSEWDLSAGQGSSRIFCIESDDHGQSWVRERDISAEVHRPDEWRVQRPTLGHALQLRSGRIFFAGVFTESERSVFQSQNYAFWSDDLGQTWTLGSILPHIGLNEAIAVELENGGVCINSRAYIDEKSVGKRGVTVGHFVDDQQMQFEPTRFDPALTDPAVQASVIRYSWSDQGNKSRILFSNPDHPAARYNLTVRLSYDEGQNWPVSRSIDPGPSAYSDLVTQEDGEIGVLYERGNQGGIAYAHFSLDWLTHGQDRLGD